MKAQSSCSHLYYEWAINKERKKKNNLFIDYVFYLFTIYSIGEKEQSH